jgi:hypothetical protein
LLLNSHHSAVKHFSKVTVKNLPPSFGMNSAFSVAEVMQVSENNRQNTAQNFLCNIVVILVSLAGEQIKSQSIGWRKRKESSPISLRVRRRQTTNLHCQGQQRNQSGFLHFSLSVWIGVAR